jgi:hypothetical protein
VKVRTASTVAKKAPQFRAHSRRPVRLRVLVTHVAEGWQRHGWVIDLGLGGACVVVDGLHADDTVTLSFVAPTLWDPLVMRATVVWARASTPMDPARAGVQFEHKSAAAVFALFELVGSMAYE